MAHRAATDEICVAGVWGTPHQAKGGDSSESPPAVFWLQKTLLATLVGNHSLLGDRENKLFLCTALPFGRSRCAWCSRTMKPLSFVMRTGSFSHLA